MVVAFGHAGNTFGCRKKKQFEIHWCICYNHLVDDDIVDKDCLALQITFPSGAFVRVDTYRWFGNWYYANFVVQVPSDDYKCTHGLCGTFDGKKDNEMIGKGGKIYRSLGRGGTAPPQFAESWK